MGIASDMQPKRQESSQSSSNEEESYPSPHAEKLKAQNDADYFLLFNNFICVPM